jgi:hypothetical protein
MIVGMGACRADALIGYFDLNCPFGINCAPGQGGTIVTGSTVGQVTFTLNNNGTIAANLIYIGPGTIVGFAFNSNIHGLPQSGFTPVTPDTTNSVWNDPFGIQHSGFADFSGIVGLHESWTIDGNYTSVYQVLTADRRNLP